MYNKMVQNEINIQQLFTNITVFNSEYLPNKTMIVSSDLFELLKTISTNEKINNEKFNSKTCK
jgi:hypothetical protein